MQPEFLSRWPERGPLTSRANAHCGARAEMVTIAEPYAAAAGVSMDEFRNANNRGRFVVWFRHGAMAAIYATGRFSLPTTGGFFHQDHTTALYAVRAVKARSDANAMVPPRPVDRSERSRTDRRTGSDRHLEALSRALAQQGAA